MDKYKLYNNNVVETIIIYETTDLVKFQIHKFHSGTP